MSEFKPASDAVIDDMWVNVLAVVQHEHPKHEDIYCQNLLAYMGERMGVVLERLRTVEAERDANALAAQQNAAELDMVRTLDRQEIDRLTAERDKYFELWRIADTDVTVLRRALADAEQNDELVHAATGGAPVALNGCDECSVEPGETHRHPGCPNCAPGYDCERGIYTPDGGEPR